MPHFQTGFNFPILAFQFTLVLFLLKSFHFYLSHDFSISKLFSKIIFILLLAIHLIALFLVNYNKNELYILWNRLGSGTMFENDRLAYWGDLAHVFSALECDTPILIGANLCDPWFRPFNQNPHLIKFMDMANITNFLVIGMLGILLFYGVFYKIMLIDSKNNLLYLALIISPPIVLALDRGNEIITFILIIFGIYFLRQDRWSQFIGGILFSAAAFYKLWPICLIAMILVIAWRELNFSSKISLVAPIVYWFVNFNNALDMVENTDTGSPLGLSFGFNHYLNGSIPAKYVAFLCCLLGLILLRYIIFIRRAGFHLVSSAFDQKIFLTLIGTYSLLWLFGTNYVYRLIILIPVALYISIFLQPRVIRLELLSLILVTFVTSRLAISTVLTSLLALIFILICFIHLRRFLNEYPRFHNFVYRINKALSLLVVKKSPTTIITKK